MNRRGSCYGALIFIPLVAGGAVVLWGLLAAPPDRFAEEWSFLERVVSEPVDAETAGRVEIDAAENAFEFYEQAAPLVVSMPVEVVDEYDAVIQRGWEAAGNGLREWLEKNRPALELLFQGSERTEALYRQPAELTWKNAFGINAELRQLTMLARMEGLRLVHAGDFAGAWSWYRALLRASRHWGRHGTEIERLMGQTAHAFAVQEIARWATYPEVDKQMIEASLDEVRAIYSQTAASSGPLSVDYLIIRKILSDPKGAKSMAEYAITRERRRETAGALLERCREPKRSLIVLKLAYANWLSQCDRPRASRAPTAPGTLELYDVVLGTPNSTSGVGPAEIERSFSRAVIARYAIFGRPVVIDSLDRERARHGMLELALALQLYFREEGEFPETLQALVGRHLARLPVDPFGRGQPLRYRRETEPVHGATLWSAGPDEMDDDARIEFGKHAGERGDLILHLKPARPLN